MSRKNVNNPRRARWLRWLVRGAVLAAAVAALLPPAAGTRAAVVVPALSPLVAIAAAVAARTFQATALLGLLVAATALVRPRAFCRWVCPAGTCAEGVSRLGLILRGLLRPVFSLVGYNGSRHAPLAVRRCSHDSYVRADGTRSVPATFLAAILPLPPLPALGTWIAIVTLGGACLGYPLLAWLDPLAMFSGMAGLAQPASASALAYAMLFPLVLLLSLLVPGVWCVRLCPLGAVQEMLAILGRGVRSWAGPRRTSGLPGPARGLARRVVLGGVVGGLWAAGARTVRGAAVRALRPPGARDEASFVGMCVRCGNCVRACPSQVLAPDPGQYGLASLLTPVVRFRQDYCRERCTRCMDVCPSGALVRWPPADKPSLRIGLPQVDMKVCLLADDRDCAICRNNCPYEAIAMVFSEINYTLEPRIDPQKCPGCGACEAACPTEPVKAIVVRPLE